MMIAKKIPANLPSERQVMPWPQVLTQLSSEYFALRSCENALGLVDRRLKRLRMDEESVEREVTWDKNGKIGMGYPRNGPKPNILNPKVGGLYLNVSKASVKASLPCPSKAFISVWQFAFASACDSVNAKFKFTLFPSFNIDFSKRPNHFRWLGSHSPKSPWLTSCFRRPTVSASNFRGERVDDATTSGSRRAGAAGSYKVER